MRLPEQAMKRASLFLVLSALAVCPAVASAQDQPWLQDRRYTEGIGYRVGDFELHPGAALEFGYDSNYFRRSNDEGPVGSMRLRITPSFSLSTLGRQRREVTPNAPPPDVEFTGSVSATYNEFFPVSGPQSGKDEMSDARNVGGDLDLRLTILPNRPWGGNVYAGVSRLIAPTNEGITSGSFNRDLPRAGAELVWQPGGGLFDWRLGYQFQGTIFEDSRFSDLTSLQHTAATRGRWRFLPRTALMFDGKFGFITYPNPADKTNSHPMRAQLGINGLVTNWFALLAMAGWGASFYDNTDQNHRDFDSVIAQAEIKFYLTPNPSTDPAAASLALSSLAFGFTRDFYDSFIGTYYEHDRGYARLSYFFGGRFLLLVDGGVGPVVYPDMEVAGTNVAGFTDIRVDASLFGEYRIKNWFGINSTVRYGTNISGQSITVGGNADSLQWQQFEAYLGARWLM
jgi:hypothetical protein